MSTTPTTSEEFLETVVQSGLLTPDQLRPYARTGGGPEEHRALANRLIKDRLLTPFQVRQLLAGKIRGYFLADKYKVLALVGNGVKGPVLLCEYLRHQQLVAAKLVQRASADESNDLATALERYVREVLAVPALDHPNIVRVHDVERTGPVPFVVMDYVDGTSLQQIVAQSGPLAVNRAAYYIRQAAVGLRHAHGKGLIHRDIKPGNLLLDRTGVIKVLDLGLGGFFRDFQARTATDDEETEDPAATEGMDYISPEQASNSAGPTDSRSDVYSLGATLYYLLTGRPPIEGESSADKLRAIQYQDPIPVQELRPEVPHGLADVLARMMAKNPNDRHQAPVEVIADLAPWARDPVPPPPAAEMPRVPPSAYRLGLVSGPGQSPPTPGLLSEVRWGLGHPSGSGTGTYTPAGSEPRNARPPAPTTPPPSMLRRPGPATSARPSASPPTATRKKDNRTGSSPALPLLPDDPLGDLDAPPPPPPPPPPVVTLTPVVPPAGPPGGRPPEAPARRGRYPSPLLLGIIGGAVLLAGGVWLWLRLGGLNESTVPTPPRTSPARQQPQGNPPPRVDPPAQPVQPPAQPAQPMPPPKVNPSPPAPGGVLITGSGSTFIKPAMDHWAQLYEQKTGVKIKYDGIGSGRGIENMIDRVLDFGCTDAFMTDKQLDKAKATNGEVLHIPLAMGAVVATYNLPEVTAQLRFTGPVLADIYLGKIKTWNHDAIAANNPGVPLPDLPITVIHRSDSSGTTAIWTDYLQKASAEWEKKGILGPGGPAVKWPIGEEGEKSTGVAKAVSKKVGALGYVELSFALEQNLKYAQVKNPSDRFINPTLESVTAAANAALLTIPADLRYTLTDVPAENAYPIVGTTWAVVYVNQPGVKGKELVNFLRWAVHDGQQHLKPLKYASLPPKLAKIVDEKLASIQTGE